MSGVSGAGPLGVVDSGFLGSGQQRAVPIPTVAANQPPVANGGPDRTAPLGSLATLDGRASSDPDGGPAALAFSWTQSSGPAVTLLDATTATPRFTPSAAGSYTFTLVVSDGPASSAPDDVTVTVACTAAYGFTGVFPSVDNPPVYNEATAGPAIPVKFSLGGDQGLGIFATGYPSSALVACASSELTDGYEQPPVRRERRPVRVRLEDERHLGEHLTLIGPTSTSSSHEGELPERNGRFRPWAG